MRKLLPIIEHSIKNPIFGCRMCGQCILHSTGMTCPMTCPKTLRNGPCGGVREDGGCEVEPEMTCVWLTAEKRHRNPLNPSKWQKEFNQLHPPVDNQLNGTSSWINFVTKRDQPQSKYCADISRAEQDPEQIALSLVENSPTEDKTTTLTMPIPR